MSEGDAPELLPGEGVSGYQVKRLLGRGGFGEVYLVVNMLTRAEMAMKVFRPSEANVRRATSTLDEALRVLRKRFVNEARALQVLRPVPTVVDVWHVDELAGGEPYYVMPYLPESLADRIDKDEFERGEHADLADEERPRALGCDEGCADSGAGSGGSGGGAREGNRAS